MTYLVEKRQVDFAKRTFGYPCTFTENSQLKSTQCNPPNDILEHGRNELVFKNNAYIFQESGALFQELYNAVGKLRMIGGNRPGLMQW